MLVRNFRPEGSKVVGIDSVTQLVREACRDPRTIGVQTDIAYTAVMRGVTDKCDQIGMQSWFASHQIQATGMSTEHLQHAVKLCERQRAWATWPVVAALATQIAGWGQVQLDGSEAGIQAHKRRTTCLASVGRGRGMDER